MNLIPLLGGFFYYATPENDWVNTIQPYISHLLVPEDSAAIQKLFEGMAQGERIPWGAWATPLMAWSLFAVNMYFTTLCVLVVLRKQWVERERLNFPLATLPIEMSARDKDQALAPFYRNYLTWIGFAIPRAHQLHQRPAPLFQLRPLDRPQPLGALFAQLHLGQLSPAL